MLTKDETETVDNIWDRIAHDVAYMTSVEDIFNLSLKEARRNRKGHGEGLAKLMMVQAICEGVMHKNIPQGHIASRAHDSLLALQVGCNIGRYVNSGRSCDQTQGAKIRKSYRAYGKTVSEILSLNIARITL